ncbi:hypothetical protein FIBSPDRAFT_857216 [Athelia psychrophila]|uniref:Uncharacterized protein n=1 Tax=Athelia psychrophila TaxID=1759441 RepID=A0A166MZX0_9AGAM|nr:hypothetical protein FIBSPDRAFT_857216 [Fibularhizoctonia sp. CBS 109695]
MLTPKATGFKYLPTLAAANESTPTCAWTTVYSCFNFPPAWHTGRQLERKFDSNNRYFPLQAIHLSPAKRCAAFFLHLERLGPHWYFINLSPRPSSTPLLGSPTIHLSFRWLSVSTISINAVNIKGAVM